MVIAKTAVAVSAVADEDAAAAAVAVVGEAKVEVEKVAPRADRPWVAQKVVGQRTRSLPRPHLCRRVTVAIIIMRTVARERARASSRALLRNTANPVMSRSSRASHIRLLRHNRTTGLHRPNSGSHLRRRDPRANHGQRNRGRIRNT